MQLPGLLWPVQQTATFSALAYGPFGDTGRPERSFAKFQLCTAIGVEQMPLQSEQIVIKLLPLHCIESISNASICLLKSCQSSAPCRIKDRCHEAVCVCVYLALVETFYSATYLPTVESCCWQRRWQSAVYQFIYHADWWQQRYRLMNGPVAVECFDYIFCLLFALGIGRLDTELSLRQPLSFSSLCLSKPSMLSCKCLLCC